MPSVARFAGKFDLVTTKTENGAGEFVFRAGSATCSDLVFGCEGFSLSQIQNKAAMPMRMSVTKNLFPGFFCFGAEANCLRNCTLEFKYENRF